MAKSTDFPNNIREFGMSISRFSHRYYDYDIFADFIDYMICCFRLHGDPETVNRLKEKYKDDYPKFFELYKSFLICQQRNLSDDNSHSWYDTLGTIYEVISSSSKASRLGQFFTPPSLCDMMAMMQVSDLKDTEKTVKVNDCACGSGRTLLAFNKFKPGQLLYGEDLDPICTKMATINLALHGCKGQVCNMNSLTIDDWYFGYQINPWQYSMMGIPHIIPIQKEQSFAYMKWQQEKDNPKPEPEVSKPIVKPAPEMVQLKLF